MMTHYIFWSGIAGVIYAYFGFPLLMLLLSRVRQKSIEKAGDTFAPSISIIIPAHNEEAVIREKLENTQQIDYPVDKLEIVVVSDGSTDSTDSIVKHFESKFKINFFRVEERKGKANALNKALENISGEIVIFSDSSIMLEKDSVRSIVGGFADKEVGCISGEDHIPGGGGEGLYGRYELFLRNLESASGSIVGASGSFYAQRKELCSEFVEGLAPDFLSVLNTVEQGYRAVTEPAAKGYMSAVRDTHDEFKRKVRTLLRGMSTLWQKRSLMNPSRYGLFAVVLISHKLFRWLVPLFLVIAYVSNLFLIESAFYFWLFVLQTAFYVIAIIAGKEIAGMHERLIGKVPLYFSIVNLAIVQAWIQFFRGVRQEIWEPSKRA